jgi:S1-C subfamily serine protease
MAGQPAHQAGLRVGDIVVEVDGAGVADAMALHERIVRSPPGSRIDLHLLRGGHDGAPDRVTAVLGEVGSRDGRRAH